MRYTYGIMDGRKILAYKPELFRKTDDLLIFPGKEFDKWYSDITEYIDGLYQVNSKIHEDGRFVDITDLNLAIGILSSITDELDHIFNPERSLDFSYHYVSTVDEKYKKRNGNYYGRYMQKIDIIIPVKPVINYRVKQGHLMELLDYANRKFDLEQRKNMVVTLKKVQKKISDLL